jgi:hypothetical protein
VNNKWFTNRGQVIQTVLALIACIVAGFKAFPDFQRSQFLTLGSLLFVFIAASVVISLVQFGLTVRQAASGPNTPSWAIPQASFSGQYRGKYFACSSGLSRIGKKAGVWIVWTAEGSLNAAVATFKNETNKTLRNVTAFASFYDEKNREIDKASLPWIDERHGNTGFAPGESHMLLLAILAKETDKGFSVPDGKPLNEGNIAAVLNLIIDNGQGLEKIHFDLATTPYFRITPVKP